MREKRITRKDWKDIVGLFKDGIDLIDLASLYGIESDRVQHIIRVEMLKLEEKP